MPGGCSPRPAKDGGLTEAEATEDRLLGGQIVLRQPRDGFRAAIDSVLLAAAVPAKEGDTVFEPGAGVGAAALCLARRVEGVRVAGVELQPDLVRLAGENARLNGLEDRVAIMVGALERLPPRLTAGSFDHVLANPPHNRPDRADAPPHAGKAAAVVEGETGLQGWIELSLSMLRPKGSLTVIHRADRLEELLACLGARAGDVAVFPLWPGRRGKPAKRVIVRARKGVANPLRLLPGLVLHEDDGGYTPEADAVLRGAALTIQG